MSTLTTTTVNTNSTTTNLTLMTGNNEASKIVVGATGEGIILSGNSSTNSFVINSTSISTNVTTTFANVVVSSVNVSTINLLGSSISTTGFSKLPNGLLMQWGTVSANSTVGTITFTTPFAAAPYSVQLTPQSNVSTGEAVTTANTTTATVRTTLATTYTFYYMALGV